MLILGLTGSIGMGKSATAHQFRQAGVPVHDADATVHTLYQGRAASLIETHFPGTTRDGHVDRNALAGAVLGKPHEMQRLEKLIHPLVGEEERHFLQVAKSAGHSIAVLDIPLLFETTAASRVDVIVVVSAPFAVQKQRVLARTGMTEDKFAAILSRQLPDDEKRRRAHTVIDTSAGHAAVQAAVAALLRALAGVPGHRI